MREHDERGALIDLDFEADPVAGDETTSVREDIDALHPGQEAPRRDDELERVRVLQLVDVGALAVVARQDEESVAWREPPVQRQRGVHGGRTAVKSQLLPTALPAPA